MTLAARQSGNYWFPIGGPSWLVTSAIALTTTPTLCNVASMVPSGVQTFDLAIVVLLAGSDANGNVDASLQLQVVQGENYATVTVEAVRQPPSTPNCVANDSHVIRLPNWNNLRSFWFYGNGQTIGSGLAFIPAISGWEFPAAAGVASPAAVAAHTHALSLSGSVGPVV